MFNVQKRTEWVWKIAKASPSLCIAVAVFLPDSNLISVCIYDASTGNSNFLSIDAIGGSISKAQETRNEVQGQVASVAGHKDTRQQTLFALTKNGEVISLTHEYDELATSGSAPPTVSRNIPKLPEHIFQKSSLKRPAVVLTMEDLEERPTKQLSLETFGGFTGEGSASTMSLPMLSGAFARAFVGRHLRGDQEN